MIVAGLYLWLFLLKRYQSTQAFLPTQRRQRCEREPSINTAWMTQDGSIVRYKVSLESWVELYESGHFGNWTKIFNDFFFVLIVFSICFG